jgi:two-component sensor histidine kinase
MTTNASKYGALSAPAGAVKVGWRVVRAAASPFLRIDWTERGGPRAESPAQEGFGLSFVKRSVAYELHGSAELTFKPGGLQARIQVPMTELRREPDGPPG